MKKTSLNKKQAQELKGTYYFKSPYHEDKRPLPFIVTGMVYFNDDFPIEVNTVSYRGYNKSRVNSGYTYESIKEKIESGFLIKKISTN